MMLLFLYIFLKSVARIACCLPFAVCLNLGSTFASFVKDWPQHLAKLLCYRESVFFAGYFLDFWLLSITSLFIPGCDDKVVAIIRILWRACKKLLRDTKQDLKYRDDPCGRS